MLLQCYAEVLKRVQGPSLGAEDRATKQQVGNLGGMGLKGASPAASAAQG